uniref:Putative secreted protein n=1 Tax=Ixodes ricinus TaxID=34613 RepID=A0A6B0TX36_IXORI
MGKWSPRSVWWRASMATLAEASPLRMTLSSCSASVRGAGAASVLSRRRTPGRRISSRLVPKSSCEMLPPPNSFFRVALVEA